MPLKKLEEGYLKADARNLPKVNSFMVYEFLTSDTRFNTAESRNVKLSINSRESYGDSAIGYVCLKRADSICTVKADVCPEHRVRQKDYGVSMRVDEREEKIIDLSCNDCAASAGGCKHAIAFMMWVHRRTEEISPTETECYWKKSSLLKVGTTLKYIVASEMIPLSSKVDKNNLPDNSNFLENVMGEAKAKQLDSQLSRHNYELHERKVYNLSMHNIIRNLVCEDKMSVADFMALAKKILSSELCQQAEQKTRDQSNSLLWFEPRYGRITASKVYEASKCSTADGSLINQLLGASKKFDNAYMERGRSLEDAVITVIEKKLNKKINKSGFILISSYPMLGASPDGVGEDFVVEVKCPSKIETIRNYVIDDKVNEKYKAQVMLQMFAANKYKGYFAVADPNFEQNQEVTLIELKFDDEFLQPILINAVNFWNECLYPKLLKTVK